MANDSEKKHEPAEAKPRDRKQARGPLPDPTVVSLRHSRIILYLIGGAIAAEVFFVLLDYHVNYGRLIDMGPIRRLSNIAREDGLASWFGTAQTLVIALSLWWIYLIVKNQAADRWTRAGWLTLAVFFSYMTVDDGAEVHERMGTVFRTLFEREGSGPGTIFSPLLDFFPSYTWQLVYMPILGLLGVYILIFLYKELEDNFSRGLVVTALGCFSVAVGLDFIEGLDEDHWFNLHKWLGDVEWVDTFTRERFRRNGFTAVVHFSKSAEEFLEMLANSLMWWAFLRRLGTIGERVEVRLTR